MKADVDFSISHSEEILNPSVPMALRLSGILMGMLSLSRFCIFTVLLILGLIDLSVCLFVRWSCNRL